VIDVSCSIGLGQGFLLICLCVMSWNGLPLALFSAMVTMTFVGFFMYFFVEFSTAIFLAEQLINFQIVQCFD